LEGDPSLVSGEEIRLGAIPMENPDLVIDPVQQQVVSRDPRGPTSLAKGFAVA
jgi:hypothetical protein